LVIVLTMTKRKKDRQNNDQKKKGQAKQWPKEKRTGKTMTKRKKDRQNNDHIVLPVLFSS
jgi:hypothetical protein